MNLNKISHILFIATVGLIAIGGFFHIIESFVNYVTWLGNEDALTHGAFHSFVYFITSLSILGICVNKKITALYEFMKNITLMLGVLAFSFIFTRALYFSGSIIFNAIQNDYSLGVLLISAGASVFCFGVVGILTFLFVKYYVKVGGILGFAIKFDEYNRQIEENRNRSNA